MCHIGAKGFLDSNFNQAVIGKIVGSRIEVPCAIRVLEGLKVFSYRFEDAESNERGLTSGKCGELSLEGVFSKWRPKYLKLTLLSLKGSLNKVMSIRIYSL